ncbi:hypothetical protein Xfasm12_2246 [Xylella fastidiosa M12]|nr:hypothetical protein Xfasm12_2246 [Xylella fastidiosa M12]
MDLERLGGVLHGLQEHRKLKSLRKLAPLQVEPLINRTAPSLP